MGFWRRPGLKRSPATYIDEPDTNDIEVRGNAGAGTGRISRPGGLLQNHEAVSDSEIAPRQIAGNVTSPQVKASVTHPPWHANKINLTIWYVLPILQQPPEGHRMIIGWEAGHRTARQELRT